VVKLVTITSPPLALSLPLQGGGGKSFIIVSLGLDLAVCPNAPPLFHQEKAAEQVRLDAEPVKAAHITRRIDVVKFTRIHQASLAARLGITTVPA
jgi:hypothetical protein